MASTPPEWRLLAVAYVFVFGLWGFLAKVVATRLNWQTVTLVIVLTNAMVVLFSCLSGFQRPWSAAHSLCVLAGLLGGAGSLLFYKTLSLAPASRVIPIASQYILVTVLLSFLFLKEVVDVRTWVGVALSILALLCLAGR